MKCAYPKAFVNALGSYKMGRHKQSTIMMMIIIITVCTGVEKREHATLILTHLQVKLRILAVKR